MFLLAAGLFLTGQRPFDYRVAVGREDGPGSDLPFVHGWNTAEEAGGRLFRWTAEDSYIRLAGLPPVPLVLTVDVLGADAHPAAASGLLTIGTSQQHLGATPMTRRVLRLMLPPPAGGRLDLRIHAPTWEPPNDPRVLGVQIGDLQVATVHRGIAPVPRDLFWPLLLLPLIWLALRWWAPSGRVALGAAALLCLLLFLLSLADRPRFALGGRAALLGAGWALVLASGLRGLASHYAARLVPAPSSSLLNALVLLFFGLFALRYAGRLYPSSMPGDLGFHVNRENDVIRGTVLLLSRHRGIDFPYPSALYVLLLPFRLLPFGGETLVNFANALFGACGLLAVGCLALLGSGDERVALLAASTYALLAPAIMALWWSFLPHTFAQELFVVLLAALAAGFPALRSRRGVLLAAGGLALLFTSHFGLYINMSLMLGVLLIWQLYRVRKRASWLDPRTVVGLCTAFALAQVLVLALFYSAYLSLLVGKLVAFTEGGMSAVQGGRAAKTSSELALRLWQQGLGAHYAYIGLPLALLGWYRLWKMPTTLVHGFVAATMVVVLGQAVLPFLTASDITTRWLSLAAFPVALGLALVLDALWGTRAGRLLALLVLLSIGGSTLWMWVQALAYRVRPPEPF